MYIIFLILFFFIAAPANALHINLPKDANGWTILTPSDDSRIMYVSSSGNDGTGAIYDDDDAILNGTPLTPGDVLPFATYAAAYAHARAGYPDWILIKRGDTFTNQTIGSNIHAGRSETEPTVIAAYGTTGLAPIFKVNSGSALESDNADNYIVVSGITFYAYQRNPSDPGYSTTSLLYGLLALADGGWSITSWLIEGCKFLWFSENMAQGSNVTYFKMRRSLVLDSYVTSGSGQGFFSAHSTDMVLEENVFDHNGWLIQSYDNGEAGGQATIFNHNVYMADMHGLTVTGNITSRSSSIGTKFTGDVAPNTANDLSVINNLYIDNEVGISAGGNSTDAYRFTDAIIDGNVIANLNESHPTNRELALGIELQDWDGGSITNNYIIHSDEANSYAISSTGTSRNVTLSGNTIYEFKSLSKALDLNNDRGSTISGFVFSNNNIQLPIASGYLIEAGYDPSGKWAFSGNKYYSGDGSAATFYFNSGDRSFSDWQAFSEDTSTFEQATFPEPTRSIETYMTSIGETNTLAAFIAAARAQDRYDWDARFTAPVVNAWIKAGFVEEEEPATTSAIISGGVCTGGVVK